MDRQQADAFERWLCEEKFLSPFTAELYRGFASNMARLNHPKPWEKFSRSTERPRRSAWAYYQTWVALPRSPERT